MAADAKLAYLPPDPIQPGGDMQQVLHELRVHQIELEMQNDELRRVQAERDTSRAHFLDLYDLAPVGYCTVSEQGLILQANLTMATLLDMTRDALINQPFTRLVFKDDQDSYYLLTKRLRVNVTDRPQACDVRIVKRHGTPFWAVIKAIATDEGGARVLRLALSDITERKRAEAALRVGDQALKAVSQGVLITTPDQCIISVNDAFVSITGYSKPEILGQNCRFLQGPLTNPQTVDAIRLALTNDTEFAGDILNYRKDGTTFWNELTISSLWDEHGQRTHFIGVTRDVTHRKQAEEALRIAAIAFESQEAMIVMDADRKILRVNQAFTQITGYAQQEVLGKSTALLRPPIHPDSFYEEIWRDINATGAWQGEMWQRRKNGEDYPARVTTTIVRDETGQITHYVGNIKDATNHQRQEQQRLRHEAAHRNTLVSEVHHRIKNNLQGIAGLLRQFAQHHPETAEPINQAIGQMQGISVIHGLQGRADTSSVRLCELTSAIAQEIQNLWQTPVTLNIPPAWRPCVIAEKEAVPIALVLNELIVNAVKHGGKAQGDVSITLRKGPGAGMVQIRIVNVGQLSSAGDKAGATHRGLPLITALMPPHGARLVREQHGERVITLLELEAPIVSPELKDLP